MNTNTSTTQNGYILKRPFGNTGEMLSVLGFGSIVLVLNEQKKSKSIGRRSS